MVKLKKGIHIWRVSKKFQIHQLDWFQIELVFPLISAYVEVGKSTSLGGESQTKQKQLCDPKMPKRFLHFQQVQKSITRGWSHN